MESSEHELKSEVLPSSIKIFSAELAECPSSGGVDTTCEQVIASAKTPLLVECVFIAGSVRIVKHMEIDGG